MGHKGCTAVSTTITHVTGLSSQQPRAVCSNTLLLAKYLKNPVWIFSLLRDQMETVGESCNAVFGRLSGGDRLA